MVMVMMFQCFDTVGSVTGRASGLYKAIPKGVSLADLRGPGITSDFQKNRLVKNKNPSE